MKKSEFKTKMKNNNKRHLNLPGKPFCLKEKDFKCKYCYFIKRGKRKGEWKKMSENNKEPRGTIGEIRKIIREITNKNFLEDFLAHYDWNKAREEMKQEKKRNLESFSEEELYQEIERKKSLHKGGFSNGE